MPQTTKRNTKNIISIMTLQYTKSKIFEIPYASVYVPGTISFIRESCWGQDCFDGHVGREGYRTDEYGIKHKHP